MTTKNQLRKQIQRPKAVDPDAPAPTAKNIQKAKLQNEGSPHQATKKPTPAPTASSKTAMTTEPATQKQRPRAQVLPPPSAKTARRIGLYLHDEDYRTLKTAELEDRADPQDRMRAMLALYRHNDRYRAAVDRLARSAPKGTGRP